MIDRVYAGCLSFADACERRRFAVLLLAAPAYTGFVAAVGWLALLHFPNSGDEYVYLYQAATLARGRLSNPAPALGESFTFFYVAQEGGRAFGTFPPGWPLALAGATALGLPAWLVNPVFGTATLSLVWALAREWHGPRVGVLATGIVALSPFFIFNAASYFSHTFCGLLLVAAACMVTRSAGARTIHPVLAGFFIGWAVVTRYLTGVLGGIAVLALVARARATRPWRTLLLVVAGGAPWLALLLAYNRALSGSMWRLTMLEGTVSNWFAPGFALRGPDILATQTLQFILWTPPALLPAYLYYLHRADRALRRRLLDGLLAGTAIALVFYVNRGGNQYGPRFYYEAFLFATIFTTAALFRGRAALPPDRVPRALFAALAISAALVPVALAAHGWHMRRIIVERTDPFTRAEAANLTNAVVLLQGRIGTFRSMDARDLTRNGVDYSGDVLFALHRGADQDCALAATFPQRSFYLYTWDRTRQEGRLTALECEGKDR